MQTRFKKNAKIFDIAITSIAAILSVGIMLYAIFHFGLREAWPELVLSLSIGITVLLRDILFPPPLANFALHLICLVLSVLLLCTLTFFYARKNWRSYTKRNLWTICIIDILIAALYNYDIYLEPINEYTSYMLTEIWIRPTITYGLVACFITETKNK